MTVIESSRRLCFLFLIAQTPPCPANRTPDGGSLARRLVGEATDAVDAVLFLQGKWS
jgi:hypothetical protein